MANSSYIQTDFSAGEWSKEAAGSYEDPNYERAMARCRNAFPNERGKWTRRPGTRLCGTSYRGQPAKLITYDFEDVSAYEMEFTDNALRFWDGSSLVTDGTFDVASISAVTPAVVETTVAHGWSTDDEVILEGLGGYFFELHARVLRITVLSPTTFSMADAVSGAPLSSSGTLIPGVTVSRIHRLSTVYGGGLWSNLRSIQTDDTAILLNGHAPYTLDIATQPDGDTPATFELSKAFFTDGPYLDPVSGGALLTPSAKTGLISCTLSFPAYVSTKAYKKGDFVTSASINYRSLQDANVNRTPAISPTWWEVVAADVPINDGEGLQPTDLGRLVRVYSEPSDWAAATAYVAGNLAKYNNVYYVSLTSNTNKIPGNDTTNWALASNAALWSWGRISSLLNLIDRTAGSTIGDMTSGGALAAAFDGDTDQSNNLGALKQSANTVTSLSYSAYAGKNYSGSAKQIYSGTLWPSSDIGLASVNEWVYVFVPVLYGPVAGATITVNLRAKATAPASASDGTLLGTSGPLALPYLNPVTVMSSDASTSWNYVWFEQVVTVPTAVYSVGLRTLQYTVASAEAQFFNPPTAAGNGFVLELLGDDLLYTNPISVWRMGAYSDTTGYPKCGTWHQGRLWLSGVFKNRIDGSRSNKPFDFSPTDKSGTVSDSHAISYTFNSPDVSPIYWMEPTREGIVCGTKKGEWIVAASTQNPALTPTNIKADRDTRVGCADMLPARCEQSLVHVQTERQKLMEHFSDAYSGKFVSPNLARMAQHFTKSGLYELAYQRERVPVIWIRTGDGDLLGCTYRRDVMTTGAPPTLNGWHKHTLGHGRLPESMAVGPDDNGTLNTLFLATAGATGSRYIEMLTQLNDEEDPLADSWLLDGALVPTYQQLVTEGGQAGVRLYGLWLLEGQSVSVTADGIVAGRNLTVANGTLFVPFTKDFQQGEGPWSFIVGSSYVSQGQLLRPHNAQDTGAPPMGFGDIRRGHQYGVQLVRSQSFRIGTDFAKLLPVLLRKARGTLYTASELYSDTHVDTIADDFSLQSQIAWEVQDPVPVTIAALGGYLSTQQR